MNRFELENYIGDNYGAKAEYLWARYPTVAVFRRADNKKWFAVIMTIEKQKLGIDSDGLIDVVNLKIDRTCDFAFRGADGVYPAYHMNKQNWISVLLNEQKDEFIKMLVDISFDKVGKKK